MIREYTNFRFQETFDEHLNENYKLRLIKVFDVGGIALSAILPQLK